MSTQTESSVRVELRCPNYGKLLGVLREVDMQNQFLLEFNCRECTKKAKERNTGNVIRVVHLFGPHGLFVVSEVQR